MNRNIFLWLQQELPKWVERGWLTPEGMDRIRASYGPIKGNKNPSLTRLFIVGLGLLLMGLGVFLLFAGYWYSFSPNGRFDLVLFMAIIALLIIGVARWKGPSQSICREGAGIVYYIVMLVAFFLLGDTYYLGKSYGLYVLFLALLGIGAAYFLEASFLMGLSVITAAFWSSTEEANLIIGGAHSAWLLLVLGVPYFRHILITEKHWSHRKIFLSWAYVIAVYMTFFFTFSKEAGSLIIVVLTNLAVITYCLGLLAKATGFWMLPFRSIGILGLLYVIYIGTFKGTWEVIHASQGIGVINQVITFGTLAITLFLGYKVFRKKYYLSTFVAGSSLVVGMGAIMAKLGVNSFLISVIFNQYILIVAAMFILRGTFIKQVTLVNGGIASIVVLVLGRFFDPGFTFVERGISFLVVGAILLVANALYMYKKAKENQVYNEEVRRSKRNNNRRQIGREEKKLQESLRPGKSPESEKEEQVEVKSISEKETLSRSGSEEGHSVEISKEGKDGDSHA